MKLSHWTWRFNHSTLQFTMICSAETHTKPMKNMYKHHGSIRKHMSIYVWWIYSAFIGTPIVTLWDISLFLVHQKDSCQMVLSPFSLWSTVFSPPWFGEIAIHIWLISLFWLHLHFSVVQSPMILSTSHGQITTCAGQIPNVCLINPNCLVFLNQCLSW